MSVFALEKAIQVLTPCFVTRKLTFSQSQEVEDSHAAAHSSLGDLYSHGARAPWCYSAGDLCSLPDEKPQVICESPMAPGSLAIKWIILCLMPTPPAHPSGEESAACGPAIPPPGGSAEPRLCWENRRVQNLLHKGLEMSSGGGERCLLIISCLGESASRQSKLFGSGSASCTVK